MSAVLGKKIAGFIMYPTYLQRLTNPNVFVRELNGKTTFIAKRKHIFLALEWYSTNTSLIEVVKCAAVQQRACARLPSPMSNNSNKWTYGRGAASRPVTIGLCPGFVTVGRFVSKGVNPPSHHHLLLLLLHPPLPSPPPCLGAIRLSASDSWTGAFKVEEK